MLGAGLSEPLSAGVTQGKSHLSALPFPTLVCWRRVRTEVACSACSACSLPLARSACSLPLSRSRPRHPVPLHALLRPGYHKGGEPRNRWLTVRPLSPHVLMFLLALRTLSASTARGRVDEIGIGTADEKACPNHGYVNRCCPRGNAFRQTRLLWAGDCTALGAGS